MELFLSIFIFAVLIAAVVLDAFSDAFIDTHRKRNHLAEALSVLCFLIAIIADSTVNGWVIFVVYVLLRVSLFNLTYNLYRGLGWSYRGETDFVDRMLSRFNKFWYAVLLVTTFLISVTIYFKEVLWS